jgi:1-acyl-sn-glycerol-3-phosphate acyltransferase
MSAEGVRLPSTATALADVATRPSPPARRRTLRRLHADVYARLLQARSLESEPPERYGFSLTAASWMYTFTGLLYRLYFRTQPYGIDALPHGPLLLISNHASHSIPWDGANITSACLLDADPPRLVHGMAEHRLMELPILGYAARRIGAVDGRRPECIRLLRAGAAVLAFPEGTRAHVKPFRQRYQLARLGQGFVHVAMETGAPIVPVAVIGGEEEAPLLANPSWLRRLVRTPIAPITPTLFIPFPVRYRIHFGRPIHVAGPATPERVSAEVDRVRLALMDLIKQGLAARRHVFF